MHLIIEGKDDAVQRKAIIPGNQLPTLKFKYKPFSLP